MSVSCNDHSVARSGHSQILKYMNQGEAKLRQMLHHFTSFNLDALPSQPLKVLSSLCVPLFAYHTMSCTIATH